MFEKQFETIATNSKCFNAFQMLKLLSFLLRVTCVIFARATNTDVGQAIVARATELRKNYSKPP